MRAIAIPMIVRNIQPYVIVLSVLLLLSFKPFVKERQRFDAANVSRLSC